MNSSKKLHIAILSSPGVGHVVSVLALGNQLATRHDVHVTVLVVSTKTSEAESQLLVPPTGNSNHVDIIEIPAPALDHPKAKVVSLLCLMMRKALPSIRSAISSLKNPPNVLIVDIFGSEAFSIARDHGMSRYVYIPSTAWFTAITMYCDVLDKETEGEYVEQQEPLKIPGCKPVRPEEVPDPMLSRTDQQYGEYVQMGIEYSTSHGILLNTWQDIEGATLKALNEDKTLRDQVKVPVFAIGPLTRPVEPSGSGIGLMEWLDKQPRESVIYVSFGSGGTLSAEQITELAWGLELSDQRFLWLVRPPADGVDGSFFTSGTGSDCNPDYLPSGFTSRTHNVGLVVPTWAPQVAVLNHEAIGGFLTHCGWNSVLESISSGVPMVAWPLYAEQKMNTTLLTEELGVAVRPPVLPTNRVVRREEIEKMVRTLMQHKDGNAMRDRVNSLKHSANEALSEGGSSYNALREVIKQCQFRLQAQGVTQVGF